MQAKLSEESTEERIVSGYERRLGGRRGASGLVHQKT
jgi:hypothetical protein